MFFTIVDFIGSGTETDVAGLARDNDVVPTEDAAAGRKKACDVADGLSKDKGTAAGKNSNVSHSKPANREGMFFSN